MDSEWFLSTLILCFQLFLILKNAKKKKKILDSFFNLDEASQRRMLETDYIDHPGYFSGALLCLFESCQPISHYQVKGTDHPSPEHTNSRQAHLLCPSGV